MKWREGEKEGRRQDMKKDNGRRKGVGMEGGRWNMCN